MQLLVVSGQRTENNGTSAKLKHSSLKSKHLPKIGVKSLDCETAGTSIKWVLKHWFLFCDCTNFYGTSTRISQLFFCACFSTPFSNSAHLSVRRLLPIESPVAVQVLIRVHSCLSHMGKDDMSAWFGYHPPGTH